MQGKLNFWSRVVTAYAPCGKDGSGYEWYYKQVLGYIQKNDLRTNPKAFFREDLCRELRHWRSLGDCIILMMVVNKNVLGGIRLHDLKDKTAAATINLYFQHYGTDSPLSIYLMATPEKLHLELGVRHCLF